MVMLKENCPVCHKEMKLAKMNKNMIFRGVEINYQDQAYVCPVCKMEVGSTEQTAAMQKKISNAYRKSTGLLTSEEIRENRDRLGLSQKALAARMTVGIASIKRWEGGIIQSKSMDKALRNAFVGIGYKNKYNGNRKFSIPRVKLVVKYFESLLPIRILLKGDKMLFGAKYLWYADFVAHREIGISMTGSTYAALPYGPQINNYKDLIDPIKKANDNEAEPLTLEEKNIIKRIVDAFPEKQNVFDASHLESIWKKRTIGEIIPYSDSSKLEKM